MMSRGQRKEHQHGVTLVDVMIVVVILGILAAAMLPQLTSPGNEAKEAALVQDLQTLRSQIELYKFQHLGSYPGKGSTDSRSFLDAMLLSSDASGNTGEVGAKPFGPYFIGQIPPNPYNGGRGVKFVSNLDAAVSDEAEHVGRERVGWIYNPETGQIKANCEGLASDKTPLQEF